MAEWQVQHGNGDWEVLAPFAGGALEGGLDAFCGARLVLGLDRGEYEVDFTRLAKCDLATSTERALRRSAPAKWEAMSRGEFQPLAEERDAEVLEAAYAERRTCALEHGKRPCAADLVAMTRTDLSTGEVRKVRRVDSGPAVGGGELQAAPPPAVPSAVTTLPLADARMGEAASPPVTAELADVNMGVVVEPAQPPVKPASAARCCHGAPDGRMVGVVEPKELPPPPAEPTAAAAAAAAVATVDVRMEGAAAPVAAQSTLASDVGTAAAEAKAVEVPQRVVLVRHGEGRHNATGRCSMVDPELTERGVAQARALKGNAALDGCDLLVVSPLRRAVQTAVAIFGEQPPCRVVLTALHSERWSGRCDEGTPKAQLLAEFPFLARWAGFDELSDGTWWATSASDGNWRRERVPAFGRWLRALPERRVVVVGHGAFFSPLASRYLDNCEAYELPPDAALF
eukprot:NODE_5690_length_1743_cov_7.766708.p1 GENE.NODE_5690_length_1743_cov_7.766708~~NODE_5690_length_1743_cov_7.766708.p1  ORF type:complete len:456 (+),score=100.48 NODE_5690_length_1743_cov_7.766708:118-1485(+)